MPSVRVGTLATIVVLVLGGLFAIASDQATSLKAARKAAERDARSPDGRHWERNHASWLGPALTPIMKRCTQDSPEGRGKDFSAYLRLSVAGQVAEALVDPANPFTSCFASGVRTLTFPDVPREDYWFEIKMDLRSK